MKTALIAAACFCASIVPASAKDNNPFSGAISISLSMERVETCVASQYGIGDGYHGKRTANGERFNTHALTAAHRARRFGSTVLVTNLANGRTVNVRINDRGPFIKGRCIDLSRAAARQIGVTLSTVSIEVLR